jgi:hypothetical protein
VLKCDTTKCEICSSSIFPGSAVCINQCSQKLCRKCVDGSCVGCSFGDRCMKCDIDEDSDTYTECIKWC